MLDTEVAVGRHKLLGWPDVIQGQMERECAMVSNGYYCGRAEDSAERRAVMADERDWRLLWQIDSEDAADMMWGDGGTLFVWIRDRDLRARRFDKCWLILQCC